MGVHHSKRKNTKHKGQEDILNAFENFKRVCENKISQSQYQLYNQDSISQTLGDSSELPIDADCLNGLDDSNVVREGGESQALLTGDLKLTQHPEVTQLQNRQNARLEDMEQRISRIRLQVQESAHRRREQLRRIGSSVAQSSSSTQTGDSICRRNRDDSVDDCYNTARLSRVGDDYEMFCRYIHDDDINDEDTSDSGQVIPVRMLSNDESMGLTVRKTRPLDMSGTSVDKCKNSERNVVQAVSPLDYVTNQKNPLVYVLFPLLLPVLIIAIILRAINPNVGQIKHKPRR